MCLCLYWDGSVSSVDLCDTGLSSAQRPQIHRIYISWSVGQKLFVIAELSFPPHPSIRLQWIVFPSFCQWSPVRSVHVVAQSHSLQRFDDAVSCFIFLQIKGLCETVMSCEHNKSCWFQCYWGSGSIIWLQFTTKRLRRYFPVSKCPYAWVSLPGNVQTFAWEVHTRKIQTEAASDNCENERPTSQRPAPPQLWGCPDTQPDCLALKILNLRPWHPTHSDTFSCTHHQNTPCNPSGGWGLIPKPS